MKPQLVVMSSKYPLLTCGTIGGTLTSILPTLFQDEILRTVFLAGIGACVSFIVSLILKTLLKIFHKIFKRRKA